MDYTVKQLADLAGVSPRTLHYYDEIDLLPPSRVAQNGYRYYEEAALFRLQQILFFRELDFSLREIKAILDRPDFDLLVALEEHRAALVARLERLRGLVHTVDQTILHLRGEIEMSDNQIFAGFSAEEEQRYREEAHQRWGEEVDNSYRRWNSYTAAQKEQIMAEGQAIYRDLVAAMESGPGSPETQQVLSRWHQHLRYFYEPSIGRLRGLGRLYNEDPAFAGNLQALHPELPTFMRQAIDDYCDRLDSEDDVSRGEGEQ